MQVSILIVDDHPGYVHAMMKTIKEKIDAKFYSAWNAESTIEAIRERHFDLIILDYSLPDANGINLITNILDNKLIDKKETAIIMASGHNSDLHAQQAEKLGVIYSKKD